MKNYFVSLPDLPESEQERLSDLKDQLRYKLLDINVSIGDKVIYDQVIASYGVYFIQTAKEVRVWTDKIKSIKNGKIKRVSVNKSSKVRPGQSLMVIEYCPHEMEFNGLCAFCGADITLISKKEIESSGDHAAKQQHIIFGEQVGHRKIVKLSTSALLKMRTSNTRDMVKHKKLALVLDIDHTFLHATRDPQAKLVHKHHSFRDSVHRFLLPGHRSPYFIKIRPGFRDFLLDVAGAFDIHLYTMSMRKYAEEIVKWIEKDPKYKNLIKNLVTRDDVPSNKKLLHRLFPCDERMVIIIDDRIDVWPNAVQNVIQIHKYLFWPNTEEEININNDIQLGSTQIILEKRIKTKRKVEIEKALTRFIKNFFKELGCYKIDIQSDIILIFTHKSPDDHKLHRFSCAIKEALDLEAQKQQNHDHNSAYLYVLRNCKISYKVNSNELKRREGDRVLSCLSAVLLKIHKKYYSKSHDAENESNKEAMDARSILRDFKRAVFDGFVFVFSGVFRVDINPETTPEWKRAIEFGARCVKTLSMDNKEGVTHCITPRIGTNKTSIAQKLGLEIVHPNWMHNSTTHYLRSNPAIYRPQGWNKRKREEIGLLDKEDENVSKQRVKRVRFNIPSDNKKEEEKSKDLMESLTELVDDINQNKDLLFGGSGKDIVLKQEEVVEESEGVEEDNFDFEDIDNDIDNAMNAMEDDDYMNENENEIEEEVIMNDDNVEEEEEDEDLEQILDNELESLSS